MIVGPRWSGGGEGPNILLVRHSSASGHQNVILPQVISIGDSVPYMFEFRIMPSWGDETRRDYIQTLRFTSFHHARCAAMTGR